MIKYAIIAAGGIGNRFEHELPKQFHQLGNKPILVVSVNAFEKAIPDIRIIVVIHPLWMSYFNEHCLPLLPQNIKTVPGGESRFESVKNGLELIEESICMVAVHDAARPMIRPEMINKGFRKAESQGSAVPAIQPTDSVRFLDAETNRSVNRDKVRLIQTPQIFNVQLLREGYAQSPKSNFTDDAAVVEACGYQVNLYEGDARNIKITTEADLRIARSLYEEQ